jgi:hypothetical protein
MTVEAKPELKPPVLVPGDVAVGFILKYEHRQRSFTHFIALCFGCAEYIVAHPEHAAGHYGIEDLFGSYRALQAHEARELNEKNAKGMCCELCGQTFTLHPSESLAWGWKHDMSQMDIRMAADDVLEITDGDGAKDDSYYDSPLVSKARALAQLVLGKE